MTNEADIDKTPEPCDEGHFAAFLRKVGDLIEAREAANPTPQTPPEPWVDKPGSLIAAERDVFCCELLERLQLPLCGGPAKCERARCRRAGRCGELESLRPLTEAARATLSREQASWRPPEAPPALTGRRRRRAP